MIVWPERLSYKRLYLFDLVGGSERERTSQGVSGGFQMW